MIVPLLILITCLISRAMKLNRLTDWLFLKIHNQITGFLYFDALIF